VITGEDAHPSRVAALAAAGAVVIPVAVRDGRIDLHAALAALAAREVRAVLVEGGGEVHGAFLDTALVDRVAFFLAPRLLGGRAATPAVGGAGHPLKSAPRIIDVELRRVGEDLLIEGDIVYDVVS
jgi:diaminohydroxyphosphoribosylaminopyrimidine deaminase/5-amino-6-(5-phosphoribosylamino)uracil reductase